MAIGLVILINHEENRKLPINFLKNTSSFYVLWCCAKVRLVALCSRICIMKPSLYVAEILCSQT